MSTQLRTRPGPDLGTPRPARPTVSTPEQTRTHPWPPTLTTAGAVFLASLSLSPLMDGPWLTWPLAIIVAVCVTGGLLAQTRTPLFLVPIAQTVVGLVLMVAAFVPDPPLGMVPSPYAVSTLRALLQQGLSDTSRYSPPVPVDPGLVALVTLGVGVCAMCAHVLAVCLRSPLLAGAPLVALYAVPAFTLPGGAPWWSFVFVVAGWMAILVTDSRQQVGAWGRVVPRTVRVDARLRLVEWSGPGLRLGGVAVVLALAIPPLVPGLTDAILGGNGSAGSSGQGAKDPDSVSLDPFASLRRDLQQGPDVPLFTYRTTSSSPAYLRAVIADGFDGEKWVPRGFAADTSPAVSQANVYPSGLSKAVDTTAADYEFTSTRLASPYLPVPYPISRLDIAGSWHWDNDTNVAFSVSDTTKNLSWRVTAVQPSPTLTQLESATIAAPDRPDRADLQSSAQVPPMLVSEAHDLTVGLTTPYEQALAIQWWLRDNFTYDINIKGDPNADQLTQFLRDRAGYCQQFAATMALMAKSLNIPARVAIGFTPGTEGANGVWQVTSHDAHAWPELFFSGVGWIRFEPTPSAGTEDSSSVPSWARESTLQQLNALHQKQATSTPSAATTAPDQSQVQPGGGAPESAGDRARRDTLIALLVLALLAAGTPAAIRVRRRRARLTERGATLAEGAWAELRDTVRDIGGGWSDADTPRQGARRLADKDWAQQDAGPALQRLARAVERARYAPQRDDAGPADLTADIRTVRRAALARLDAGERWRVRLFPPTVLRRF